MLEVIISDLKILFDLEQNILSNTTRVTLNSVLSKQTGDGDVTWWTSGEVYINGKLVGSTGGYGATGNTSEWNGVGGSSWTRSSIDILHDDTGNAAIDVRAVFAFELRRINGTKYYGTSRSGTTTVDLPPIYRTSGITASSVELGSKMSITIENISSSLKNALYYSCGTSSGTISTDAKGALTWTPPVSLASQAPSAVFVDITLTVVTYSGSLTPESNIVGRKSIVVRCPIPSTVAPSISNVTLNDVNSHVVKYGGYVRGVSKIRVVTTASSMYGATVSVTVNCAGVTSAGSDVVITPASSGTYNIIITATDSRGRVATQQRQITVIQYSAPTSRIANIFRCDKDGNNLPEGGYARIVFTGNVSPVNNKNSAKYSVAIKKEGSQSWDSISAVSSLTGVYSANGSVVISADINYSYVFCVIAEDDFYNSTNNNAKESLYANIQVAFAILDCNKLNKSIGIGRRAVGSNNVSVGLNIDMSGNVISGVGTPTNESDAVPLSYFNAIKPRNYQFTIDANSWVESDGGYVATKDVAGVKATDTSIADIDVISYAGSGVSAVIAAQTYWSFVALVYIEDDIVAVYSQSPIPISLNIKLTCFGG